MARIRTIKPEFWDSPGIETLDPRWRLLFVAMWNWADDSGRGKAEARELMGFAFPRDEDMTVGEFRRGLGEVRRVFEVVFYRVAGRSFYFIPSWTKHQKIDKRSAPRWPGPDEGEEYDPATNQAIDQPVSESRRDSAETPPSPRGEHGAGTGEQGNRGTGEEETCAPQAERETPPLLSLVPAPEKAPEPGSDDDPDWVKFWAVYPLKKSKEGARAKWRAALKKAEAATIIAGAERYAAERAGADPTYTAHPNTWLNQGRWADEPTPQHKTGYQPYQDPDPADYYGAI